MEVHSEFDGAFVDGGVLGEDLTVVDGSVRWTGNLSDWADLAGCGGAAVVRGVRGKKDKTFWGRVRARGSSELVEIAQIHLSRLRHHFWWLFWPRWVTMVAQLARAATAGRAWRANDGGSSTNL
jgi:hypothetical protein